MVTRSLSPRTPTEARVEVRPPAETPLDVRSPVPPLAEARISPLFPRAFGLAFSLCRFED
ncbi:MAG TPA: hypothetical protein VH678_21695 [Xanthobacteraceae bacterium]